MLATIPRSIDCDEKALVNQLNVAQFLALVESAGRDEDWKILMVNNYMNKENANEIESSILPTINWDKLST